MKDEKEEIRRLPIKLPKGSEPIFVLAIAVGNDGRASVAYNYQSDVKLSKIAIALKDFADNLARQHAEA